MVALPPRVVIAAPSSGSGKTTVATGLLGALAARGAAVAPFKVGPDYVDPGYHALAAGRPGRNLDPVLVDPATLPGLVVHGARGADLAVVEGVMGLFDGRIDADPDRDGSTAHVARLLDAPVVLVVDARGQSRSVAALLAGFRAFDPRVRPGGVVLNRVGSARHEQVLRAACDEVGLPVLGVLPRRAELAVPSRHLGLVTAAEHGGAARAAVDAMAALVAAHVDLDAVAALARAAPASPAVAWDPVHAVGEPVPGAPVVAVAGGAAFTFGYPEHGELLAAAGADVVTVDPVHDEALPPGTAGLVLPGGFPEEHADALSANAPLRAAVAALAASGAPVHAECGGLLYLSRSLDGAPMCGVLGADAAMGSRLALGYRTATACADSPLAAAGETVTGHEFHRTVTSPRAGSAAAWRWDGADPEGFVAGGVHASYLHTHPAGRPGGVARWLRHLSGTGRHSESDHSPGRRPS
ncbi:cobyrinate a,c-diamide synthase [Actinomycetospora cinnamomea]|uniref:Hydrogenobyrinate a,c-diamide synthase n=1 Tax=Actinomycetospora cinnamomea TaxID=663609 RepID=A0A2U1FQM4_9PSEU|nr:cobyrinate a,c-diamide synthase [Actinomycetospora cinnamomea]PVZ14449.1 cobyrinic acid a,c-diamide synthase [Actinomycetospora cinnamomea]